MLREKCISVDRDAVIIADGWRDERVREMGDRPSSHVGPVKDVWSQLQANERQCWTHTPPLLHVASVHSSLGPTHVHQNDDRGQTDRVAILVNSDLWPTPTQHCTNCLLHMRNSCPQRYDDCYHSAWNELNSTLVRKLTPVNMVLYDK